MLFNTWDLVKMIACAYIQLAMFAFSHAKSYAIRSCSSRLIIRLAFPN